MRLNDIKPAAGSTHYKKRPGRGIGSGLGKTAGRGHKGQKSRAGGFHKIGFEGGQMPLIRRIPKRGFNNTRFTTRYLPVNLESLNQFDDGVRVDAAVLKAAGLTNGPGDGVKILGDGDLTKKLTVCAHAFSASARAKIEAKGGTCEVVSAKAPAKA